MWCLYCAGGWGAASKLCDVSGSGGWVYAHDGGEYGIGRKLHPLQEAFVDSGAIQCGFCTPGMVLSAHALLQRNPDPSEAEVRDALSGNLCRCTGYVNQYRRYCGRRQLCAARPSRRLADQAQQKIISRGIQAVHPWNMRSMGRAVADDEEGGSAGTGRGKDTPSTDGDGANGGGIATLVGTRAAVDLRIVG